MSDKYDLVNDHYPGEWSGMYIGQECIRRAKGLGKDHPGEGS